MLLDYMAYCWVGPAELGLGVYFLPCIVAKAAESQTELLLTRERTFKRTHVRSAQV